VVDGVHDRRGLVVVREGPADATAWTTIKPASPPTPAIPSPLVDEPAARAETNVP
jgi:hypothetical protein